MKIKASNPTVVDPTLLSEAIAVNEQVARAQVARDVLASRRSILLHAAQRASERSSASADEVTLLSLLSTARSEGALDEVIKYHLQSLLLPAEGTVVNDTLKSLPGRYGFKQLQRFLDVQRLNATVNLPVGSLNSLGRIEQEKMASYLRLVVNRIQAMSSLPLDDVDEIASALLLLPNVITSFAASNEQYSGVLSGSYGAATAAIESTPELRAALITYVRNELLGLESRARERFIIQTVLQPLYRDVFVSRDEFKWITGETIFDMARTYARWMRTFRSGAMHSALREDITASLVAHKEVGGLASLQAATILGVRQNAALAIASLAPIIQGPDIESGYGSSLVRADVLNALSQEDESAELLTSGMDSVSIATPFGTVRRSVQLADVFGDPVGISEFYASEGLLDEDRDTILALVSALADLSGVQIITEIDFAFINRYPQWSGLMKEPGSELFNADLGALGAGFASRLEFDYIAAVLNSEMAESTLSQLFTEANKADLSKVADDGLRFYSLAHKVVMRLLRSMLDAARNSHEWYDSPVWDELIRLNLIAPGDKTPTLSLQLDRSVRLAAPAITHTDGSLSAFRYAVAPDFLVRSSRAASLFDNLKALGVVGDMKVTVSFQRPFARSGRPLVDILPLPARDDLRPAVMSSAISAASRYDFSQMQKLAAETGRDIMADYVGLGASADAAGSVDNIPDERKSFLLAEVAPYIEVHFAGAHVTEQVPLEFIYDEAIAEQGTPDADERLLLARQGHAELVQVDPTPFVYVGVEQVSIKATPAKIAMPRSVESLRATIAHWSHDITEIEPSAV